MLRAAARRSGALPWVAFSEAWEPRAGGTLAAALHGFGRLPQQGRDLGGRLSRTCRALFRGGRPGVVVIGSDSPTLPVSRLALACRLLRRGGADLILGPARDGGYYLIALRRHRPELFRRIPWGTKGVLRATLARARRARLRVRLLPTWDDIDRTEDLLRLRRDLRRRHRRRAPSTARVMARLARAHRL